MKSVLFASVAAASLALAGFAFAQTLPTPAPVNPPPIAAPSVTPDAHVEGQVATMVQTPQAQADAAAQTDATVSGAAETQTDAQAQVETAPTPATPESGAPSTAAQAGAAAAVAPAEAAANAQAMAASPATAAAAVTTPASASTVCQPRVTSVHFGARGAALSQQNRNALEYAVDAASVCSLQSVVIADSAEGRISTRRAEAVRAALVRQGVPRDRITVESAANAEAASTGQLDVRMNFAGVANAGAPTASNEAEPPTPPAS